MNTLVQGFGLAIVLAMFAVGQVAGKKLLG